MPACSHNACLPQPDLPTGLVLLLLLGGLIHICCDVQLHQDGGSHVQVGILHECRHPSVVLMLGAWLGQDQLYMVQELLATDLWHALNEPSMLDDLRWDKRCARLLLAARQLPAALCSLPVLARCCIAFHSVADMPPSCTSAEDS